MMGDDTPWLDWLYITCFLKTLDTMAPLEFIGMHALLARVKLSGPILGTIPRDQWQVEVQH